MEPLAIHGGTPVRNTPFPPKELGVSLIGDEELHEIQDVIREKSPFRFYGLGTPHKVADFETEAKTMLGCRYALAVSSGSAALYCALAALGIGVGDEVIIPAYNWFSDYNAVVLHGALPVFADIDDTLNLDPRDVERKITDQTKAVIVVYYQGCPAKIDEIMAIAHQYGLKVIEDCAQAFGGEYHGKKLGTFGDIATTSFQNNKVITGGEGGLVYTDQEELYIRAIRAHDIGQVRPYFHQQIEDLDQAGAAHNFAGLQFRMGELQGALLLAQIRKLPDILARCRTMHRTIRERFQGNSHFSFRPEFDGDCGITLFLRFPTVHEASRFAEALEAEGIPLGPSSGCVNIVESHYIPAKTLMNAAMPPFAPGYNGAQVTYRTEETCPQTNSLVGRHVAIGLGPLYSEQEIDDICAAIEKVESGLYT